MSRTKRIYNSYEKYGRFFGKDSESLREYTSNGLIKYPPKPFQIKSKDDERYTKHGVWCMGNCRSCRKNNPKHEERRKKRNKKINIFKFDTLVSMKSS